MNLDDILSGAGFITKVGLIMYGFKKIVVDKFIPYAEKLQKEYDADEREAADDYNFFKKAGEKK